MPTKRTGGVHAPSISIAPEEQVFRGAEKRHQICHTALHGSAGFSKGPSVVGSSLTFIHPIKQVKPQDQRPLPSLKSRSGDFGGACHYCPANPCINAKVHSLHMQVLRGIQTSELELNRYLLACAVLKTDVDEKKVDENSEDCMQAQITWVCDMCTEGTHNVCMHKRGYRQQYRGWKPPMFCCRQTLELPISECLVTPIESTMQYHLLPDLGMFFRGILQRRFYTDVARKQWVRSLGQSCYNNTSSGGGTISKTAYHQQAQQHYLNSKFHEQWSHMHGICASLLLESIPCMKKVKRTAVSSTGDLTHEQHLSAANPTACEVLACINVLHGTLLKLYPLGAKTPTFNAKVNVMQRMMSITSGMTTAEQLEFLRRYPALVRICFMEYSMNALLDWLPVERELLFESGAFSQHRAAMQAYISVLVPTCDVFRRDFVQSGSESWEKLNAAASSCIDRCIRVCKFKLFRMPEAIIRGPHCTGNTFSAAFLEGGMPMIACREMAVMHPLLQGNAHAESCFLLHSNLKVLPLPECVAFSQLDALDRAHSLCSKRLSAAQRLSFCCLCAINGRGSATGSNPFSSSKLRMCCHTGKLYCTVCTKGTVVTVNMVGVLLKICATYYFMCPCCTKVRAWSASGDDLCPWLLHSSAKQNVCGCHEFLQGVEGVCDDRTNSCAVCHSKSVLSRASMVLPDPSKRSLKRLHLCSKHAPPDHMLGVVTSTRQFKSIVTYYCRNKSSAQGRFR